MKSVKMDISLTDAMRSQIIANEVDKLKALYADKKRKLDDELNNEIEKLKKTIDSISIISADVELKPRRSRIDETQLKKLISEGKNINEITKLLGNSFVSITKKISELNISTNHNWKENEIDKLVELHALTLSDTEISKKMLIPVADVKKKISELKDEGVKILRKQPKKTSNEVDEFVNN